MEGRDFPIAELVTAVDEGNLEEAEPSTPKEQSDLDDDTDVGTAEALSSEIDDSAGNSELGETNGTSSDTDGTIDESIAEKFEVEEESGDDSEEIVRHSYPSRNRKPKEIFTYHEFGGNPVLERFNESNP